MLLPPFPDPHPTAQFNKVTTGGSELILSDRATAACLVVGSTDLLTSRTPVQSTNQGLKISGKVLLAVCSTSASVEMIASFGKGTRCCGLSVLEQ